MLKLHKLFQNGVVLQRGKGTKVFGSAKKNDPVFLQFQNIEYQTLTNEFGNWAIELNELVETFEPQILEVRSNESENKLTVNNILIGDVWLIAGQSNAQITMTRMQTMFPDIIEEANNKSIRYFTVPERVEFNNPLTDLETGEWNEINRSTIENCSALGYFFADEINKRQSVPIGLINCAIGGTPIKAWLPYSKLADFKDSVGDSLQLEADICKDDDYIKQVQDEYNQHDQKYYQELNSSDLGLVEFWNEPDFDDSSWQKRRLTKDFEAELQVPGAIWFRYEFFLPEEFDNVKAKVCLGTPIDEDFVYLNGKEIGHTFYRYPPRHYSCKLKSGRNVLVIRLLNQYGLADFTTGKPYWIISEDSSKPLTVPLDSSEVEWKYKRGCKFNKRLEQTFFTYKATALFNGMLNPLIKMNIKGIIWNQGEADAIAPEGYSDKLKCLIQTYRELFANNSNKQPAQIPFLFTQLSYQFYTYSEDWDTLRSEQVKALELERTGMVFTQDVGEYNDLHPQNKQIVATRLARLARSLAYNEEIPRTLFELVGYLL